MIYRIIDLPATVLGFNLSWELRRNDFEEVAIPCVKEQLRKKGQANVLFLLENIRSAESGAADWISEMLTAIQKLSGSRRAAIVSDDDPKCAQLFSGSGVRRFSLQDFDPALDWVSENSPV
jgi:hypothetical protein